MLDVLGLANLLDAEDRRTGRDRGVGPPTRRRTGVPLRDYTPRRRAARPRSRQPGWAVRDEAAVFSLPCQDDRLRPKPGPRGAARASPARGFPVSGHRGRRCASRERHRRAGRDRARAGDRGGLRLCPPNTRGSAPTPARFHYVGAQELLAGTGAADRRLGRASGSPQPRCRCRSAECAGATGVVIRERRAAEVTPAVCKASAGAVEHLRDRARAQPRRLPRRRHATPAAGATVPRRDGRGPQAVPLRRARLLAAGDRCSCSAARAAGCARAWRAPAMSSIALPLRGRIELARRQRGGGVRARCTRSCRRKRALDSGFITVRGSPPT